MTSAPWAACFWIVIVVDWKRGGGWGCCDVEQGRTLLRGGKQQTAENKTDTKRNAKRKKQKPRTRQVVGRLKADAARRARHERDLAREVGGHCLFAAAVLKGLPQRRRLAVGAAVAAALLFCLRRVRERSPCGATNVKDTCRMNAFVFVCSESVE
jgi:hypothetical protein